ncbi:MAG: biopolymer transporter ExbD [Kiritimatiellae bacterium]|nr:biopolymer transporter ExbD [Kiritimatiellia bacterium]
MAKEYAQCEIDMTPMIDVVFQLIIFFVVTMQMNQDSNQDIVLEDGKNGIILTADSMPPTTLEIEVDRRGRVSIHNATLTERNLRDILRARINKHGNEFPVLIRADRRTMHEKVRKVMDICTSSGLWKLSFVAVEEHKKQDSK